MVAHDVDFVADPELYHVPTLAPDSVIQTLFRLGYFLSDRLPDFTTDSWERLEREVNDGLVKGAIRSYQEFCGPHEVGNLDGKFGPRCLASLERRFCAAPDFLPEQKLSRRDNVGEGLPRWIPKEITFRHDLEFPGVSFQLANDMVQQAIDEINASCGVTIRNLGNQSGFANGIARVGRIDGRNRKLAWSGVPPRRGLTEHESLPQKYDRAEMWRGREMVFLRPVLLHEILHLIGLSHDNARDSIMFFQINGTQHMNDRDKIQTIRRYGPRVGDPPPPPPTPSDWEWGFVDGRIRIRHAGDELQLTLAQHS